MRIVLIILIILIALTIGFGFYIKSESYQTGEFCIGIGITVLFIVWMPLFIYHRWKNRSFKDYMLTKENIDKMRDRAKENKY